MDEVVLVEVQVEDAPCCFVCQDTSSSSSPLRDCGPHYSCTCRGIWVHNACWEQYQQRFRTCPWCRRRPDTVQLPVHRVEVAVQQFDGDFWFTSILSSIFHILQPLCIILMFPFDAFHTFSTATLVVLVGNSAWSFCCWPATHPVVLLLAYVPEIALNAWEWQHQALSTGLDGVLGFRCGVMALHGFAVCSGRLRHADFLFHQRTINVID